MTDTWESTRVPVRSPAIGSTAGRLMVAATTAVTTVLGWFAIWSAPINGDEGYLLLSLREFARTGGLYDRVYSQYGPFYYSLFGLPARLAGWTWTFTAGRLVTLVLWVLAAFMLGLAVRACTRSWALGVATQVVSFSMLSSLRNEPMHPGGLLIALIAALLWSVAWLRPRRARAADILVGALLAALVLTKVNVGVFALGAVVLVLPRGRPRWLQGLAIAGFISLGPVVVMAQGHESWRLRWAALYVAGAVAVVIAASISREERMSPGLTRLLQGFGAVAVVAVGAMVVTGSTPGGIMRGAMLRPLDHPRIVTIPVLLPVTTWLWCLVIPLTVAVTRRRSPARPTRAISLAGALLRTGAGLALLVSVLGDDSVLRIFDPDAARLALLPLVALVAVPRATGDETPDGQLVRYLVAGLAMTQSLHAFPVPGSQVSWSVLLAGVCAVMIVGDGVADSLALMEPGGISRRSHLVTASACVAIVLVAPTGSAIETPGHQFLVYATDYRRQREIGIDGTQLVRPPGAQRRAVASMAPVLRHECGDVVVLGPDLSWYLLAGHRPPTGFNQPAWFAYLSDDEQRATVNAIRGSSRLCLAVTPALGSITDGDFLPTLRARRGPLVRYLSTRRWEPVGGSEGPLVVRAL